MIGRVVFGVLAMAGLAGCSSAVSSNNFAGTRTVFDNPYGPGVGEVHTGAAFGWYDGAFYPGKGDAVFDKDGRRREMTFQERRYWDRQREFAVRRDALIDISGQAAVSTPAPELALPADRSTTDDKPASPSNPPPIPPIPRAPNPPGSPHISIE